MSTKRKIADSLNVRINIGNYQHIEITKYSEEEIEYSSEEERKKLEDNLRDDLLTNLIRSMNAIPERLNKGVDKAIEVEESIKKAIPAWLLNNPIPNIANMAKKNDIKATSEQKANKDECASETKPNISSGAVSNTQKELPVPEIPEIDEKELFEENVKSEKIITPKSNNSNDTEVIKDEGLDLFDNDDIFNDK